MYEAVIGLEVHVQLSTDSKIFSGSSTNFGAEPNTQASLIDLGMPGVLPVPNEKAFEMAVKFGLAIDAEIGQGINLRSEKLLLSGSSKRVPNQSI